MLRIIKLLICWTFALLFFISDASAFKLPDTGQTTCYDTAGNVISCASTGQDGAYNINPMSYTDNGNGTVTDNNTGLMWQKQDDGNRYNWYQASGTYNAAYNPTSQDVCGSLTLGSHSDWRLPTKKELMSIVNYGIPPPGPMINDHLFPKHEVGLVLVVYHGRLQIRTSRCTWTSMMVTSPTTIRTIPTMCGVCVADRLHHRVLPTTATAL